MDRIGTATVLVEADTTRLAQRVRVIAKHLTAMADELELLDRSE